MPYRITCLRVFSERFDAGHQLIKRGRYVDQTLSDHYSTACPSIPLTCTVSVKTSRCIWTQHLNYKPPSVIAALMFLSPFFLFLFSFSFFFFYFKGKAHSERWFMGLKHSERWEISVATDPVLPSGAGRWAGAFPLRVFPEAVGAGRGWCLGSP